MLENGIEKWIINNQSQNHAKWKTVMMTAIMRQQTKKNKEQNCDALSCDHPKTKWTRMTSMHGAADDIDVTQANCTLCICLL